MRKFSAFKASLFAASVLVMAAPAAAQPDNHDHGTMEEEQPQRPRDPNAIVGTIAEPQSVSNEHRMQMQAGQRYLITVDTEAFDAVLRLRRMDSTTPLAEDDDSGGGTTPRIVYTPTASGEYVVEVRSYAASGHGEYALSVTPQAPLPALVSRPTRTERSNWQVFQGDLGASDPADRDRRFDDYELRLAAGESAMLHVQATGETDTMLQVFTLDQRGLTPIVENDDSDGVNPFLFFAPGEAGTYVVRVIGFDETARGGYRLRVGR